VFLNPFLLAGLTAIAVPIAIHLLTRTPPRPVKWAAMRFLKVAVERHQRRLRFEDLLLMLLRCLIVALIAIALARPVLRSAGWIGDVVGAPHEAYLLLDDSMSMAQTDGAATRFDLARTASKRIVESLPVGSRVALWRGSNAAISVITEPTGDLGAVRAAIDKLQATDRATDLHAVLSRLVEVVPPERKSEVFVLTDGQRAGLRKLDSIVELLDAHKDKLGVTFVVVDRPEPANLALTGLRAADGIAIIDRPTRLVATVLNAGQSVATDVRVLLRAYPPGAAMPGGDDPGGVVDQQSIDRLQPGESKSVSLVARLRQPGPHVVEARLAQSDRLPNDDRRSITLSAVPKVRVLIVDGDLSGRGVDADSFFLQRVLVPMTSSADAQRHFVQTRVISPTRFDLTGLDDTDVVVMTDVPDLSDAGATQLRQFVDRGGGLVVFTGERTRVPFYNDTLATKLDLLPATLAPAQGDASDEKQALRIDTRFVDHPIAQIWGDSSGGALDAAKVRRRTPLTARSGARVVLRYTDGTPAVLDAFKGRGYVCLVSTTADTSWTDLPVRAGVFVPLVYRTLGQALLRQNDQPGAVAGARIDVPLPDDVAPQTPLQITGPGLSLTPPQSDPDVVAETIGGRRMASWLRPEHAGVFDVTTLSDGAKPLARFTIEPDRAESDLTSMTDAERDRLANVARVVKYDAAGTAFTGSLRSDRAGLELAPPLLALLLLLIVTELVLAQRFGRSK
jgi:hypothetical protein